MELVTRPVPGFPPVYSPGAVDAILAATACQPFLLQVLCSVVVEELNRRRWQEGHPLVDTKEVAAVLPKAAERAENYFLDVWNSQVPSPAKLLVRQLAHQGKVPAVDPADDNLVEALLALERHHILARGPNGFRLVLPLFAEYVRTRESVGLGEAVGGSQPE